MPFKRIHHQSRSFPAGDCAAIHYPLYSWNHNYIYNLACDVDLNPSTKRRKLAASYCEDCKIWPKNEVKSHQHVQICDSNGVNDVSVQRKSEEIDLSVFSRDEIERCSPSRKDGIDKYMETRLRYSYCGYLQSLGIRLDLPQMTVGTAMVLCHRFFLRRSHASNDRFLIATAALFLAAKSEETPCLLNSAISASFEICQKQNFVLSPHLLYADWFELYRDRVVEAEQLILTTLNFELEVKHPYVPLNSVFKKLGLSKTVLLNLAWNLVNEGVFTRLMCSTVSYS